MSGRVKWTPEVLAQLGRVTDRQIAAMVGCTPSRVGQKRRELLGGAAVHPQQKWSPEEVRLLGTMPDKALAERLGRSQYSVIGARRVRGIKPYSVWSDERERLLGTMTDAQLARLWGVKVASIVHARERRGIPAFQRQKPWTAEELALLGTMSDAEVARRVGRSREAVHVARYSRGIRNGVLQRHPHLDDIKREYTTTHQPVPEIAARYGVSRDFVNKRAYKRRWVRPQEIASPV